jgi:hypothetical protein
MRDLDLASRVPTKTKDDDTAKLFNASLTLSKAFTLFTFIVHGKNLPILVEKIRDDNYRHCLLYSAAPYCLSQETLDLILGADRDEKNDYLIALAENAQQVIRYVIYGLVVNYMNERDVWTSGQLYERTGPNADAVNLPLLLS